MRIHTVHICADIERPAIHSQENNDCAVWALAKVAGLPYEAAHRELELWGRVQGKGTKTHKFLQDKGWRIANYDVIWHPITGKYVQTKRRNRWGYLTFSHRAVRPSLASIRKQYPKGRYMITVSHHAFAMIDGVIHDTAFTGPGSQVYAVYEFKPR